MILPADYTAWQQHFRPEDAGRDHAANSIPVSDAKESEWEHGVRAEVDLTISDICGKFCAAEGTLASEFASLREAYDRTREAYRKRRQELGRDAAIPIKKRLALGLIGFLGIAGTFINFPLFSFVVHDSMLVFPFAAIVTAVLTLFSYFGGMILRQAKSWLPVVGYVLAFLSASSLILYLGAASAQEEQVGGIALATLEILAMGCVLLVSYYSHDRDEMIEHFQKEFVRLHGRLSGLHSQRIKNRNENLDMAKVIAECGKKTIWSYRDNNRRHRPPSSPVPSFFTDSPISADNWDETFIYQIPNEFKTSLE